MGRAGPKRMTRLSQRGGEGSGGRRTQESKGEWQLHAECSVCAVQQRVEDESENLGRIRRFENLSFVQSCHYFTPDCCVRERVPRLCLAWASPWWPFRVG